MHGGKLLRLHQWRTPKTHALRFRHGDALRLTLMDELPLCLGHIAEQLQDNVGDQGPGEIPIFRVSNKGISSTTMAAPFSLVMIRHCSRISL